MFYEGIIELILFIITIIMTTIYFKNIDNFWDYYNNLETIEIIIFISLIILQLVYYSIVFKVIELFSQYHPLLLTGLTSVMNNFIYFDTCNILFSILSSILFIVCFIMILIYVEIIELNCFGLSYMTKKNIKIRAQLDSVLEDNDDDNESKISNDDYSIDLIETKLTEISLNNGLSIINE